MQRYFSLSDIELTISNDDIHHILNVMRSKIGDKFEVVQYEVWYNQENSELMNAVASARKETPGGVPYIIVGNQSWDGFSDEYKDSIISKIESEYEQDPAERYDVMDYINLEVEKKDTTARDILLIIVLVGVVGAITAGVLIARKTTN